VGGYEWAFALNTVSFLAVVAVIAPLSLPRPTSVMSVSTFASIREGFAYVRRERATRAAFTYLGLSNVIVSPFLALIPVFALKVLDEGATATTVLVAGQGIGMVAITLVIGELTARLGHRGVLMLPLYLTPPALAAYALAPTLGLAFAAILVLGMVMGAGFPVVMTIAQLRAPTEVRGRVMGVGLVTVGLCLPLGSLVQGWVADQVGLRATLVGAAVVMAVVLIAIRVFRPGFDAAVAEVSSAPAAAGIERADVVSGS
jgi:MFS family permease